MPGEAALGGDSDAAAADSADGDSGSCGVDRSTAVASLLTAAAVGSSSDSGDRLSVQSD